MEITSEYMMEIVTKVTIQKSLPGTMRIFAGIYFNNMDATCVFPFASVFLLEEKCFQFIWLLPPFSCLKKIAWSLLCF